LLKGLSPFRALKFHQTFHPAGGFDLLQAELRKQGGTSHPHALLSTLPHNSGSGPSCFSSSNSSPTENRMILSGILRYKDQGLHQQN
jgi:hypothetical protein